MAVLVSNLFSGFADGTKLGAVPGWTVESGTTTELANNGIITGGVLRTYVGYTTGAVWSYNVGGADQSVQYVVQSAAATRGESVLLRWLNAANHIKVTSKYVNSTTSQFIVATVVGGVSTVAASIVIPSSAGDTAIPRAVGDLIRWELAGTKVKCFHNGVEKTPAGGVDVSAVTTTSNKLAIDSTAQEYLGAFQIENTLAPDTERPTFTGPVTVTPSSNSATAACPTATDNVGVTAYEASIDGGATWPFSSATTAISITGLTAGTPYTARFRAKDAAGNVSTPVLSASFTTAAAGDTTEPTQAGAISIGTVTSASIQFSWPAGADNVGVVGYDVSSNGGSTWTSLGNVLTHTFTGLTPSTAYALRVRPRDAAGNVDSTPLAAAQSTSAASGTASVTISGIANGTNTLLTVTLPNVVVIKRSDRSPLLALTSQAVTAGTLTITNAGLGAAGTGVQVCAFSDDGTQAGSWPATVA